MKAFVFYGLNTTFATIAPATIPFCISFTSLIFNVGTDSVIFFVGTVKFIPPFFKRSS